jgi:membrane protease YdiL (CAAX protease family)
MHVFQTLGAWLFLNLLGFGIAADVRLFRNWRAHRAFLPVGIGMVRRQPWNLLHVGFIALVVPTLPFVWVWLPFSSFFFSLTLPFATMLALLLLFRAAILARHHVDGPPAAPAAEPGPSCVTAPAARPPPLVRPWQQILRTGAWLYLAIVPPLTLVGLLNIGLLYTLGVEAAPQDTVLAFTSPATSWIDRFWLTLTAVVLAPLFEELLFRGVIFSALLKISSPWPAIVVQALVFALLHLHGPALLPLFTLAVTLSLAYVMTRSLWTPIIIHAMFNAVALIFSLLTTDVV